MWKYLHISHAWWTSKRVVMWSPVDKTNCEVIFPKKKIHQEKNIHIAINRHDNVLPVTVRSESIDACAPLVVSKSRYRIPKDIVLHREAGCWCGDAYLRAFWKSGNRVFQHFMIWWYITVMWIYVLVTCVKLVTVPRAKLLRLGYSYRQALNAYLFQRS